MKAILAIARTTYRELIRDKVYYGSLVVALFLLLISVLVSKLTFTRSDRVILDFGVSTVQLTQVLLGALFAAPLLAREIQRRTIQVVLSRPVTYLQFMIGKFVGLCLMLATNAALLGVTVALILSLFDGADFVTKSFAVAIFGAFLQSALVAVVALLFASFSTPGLAAILSLSLYLVGQNVSQFEFLARKAESSASSALWSALGKVVPQFEALTLGFSATYGLPTPKLFWAGFVYALAWIAICLPIASALLKRREMG